MEVGKVQKLFSGIITSTRGFGGGYQYDFSADGQKFLVVDDGASDVVRPLTLLQNWTAVIVPGWSLPFHYFWRIAG